jgi:hypothetical protein
VSDETIYYDAGDVLVTGTRVVARGKTYALAGVQSVQLVRQPRNPAKVAGLALGLAMILGGLLLGVAGYRAEGRAVFYVVAGVAVFLAGVYMLRRCWRGVKASATNVLMLGGAGGDWPSLEDGDLAKLSAVADAVNQALAARETAERAG